MPPQGIKPPAHRILRNSQQLSIAKCESTGAKTPLKTRISPFVPGHFPSRLTLPPLEQSMLERENPMKRRELLKSAAAFGFVATMPSPDFDELWGGSDQLTKPTAEDGSK